MQIRSTSHSDYQEVHHFEDVATRLRGIVAVHSTARGPAVGGTRMWRYDTSEQMEIDALRLSRGMSLKNALAGLPFGGGKAVIQLPGGTFDREALFRAYGRVIEILEGRYVTAEDVGTSVADMQAVRRETSFVGGLPARPGLAGGDPGPSTSLGVFLAIEAALSFQGGSVEGATVAVQGLGSVGRRLCGLLHEAGARLVVADVRATAVDEAVRALGADAAEPDGIHRHRADVFAPCAMGAVLNSGSVSQVGAPIVCGAANNQLATTEDGAELARRGILYCPDFLVNAGGMANIASEYLGETVAQSEARVRQLPERLTDVLRRASDCGEPTHIVAERMALELVERGRG